MRLKYGIIGMVILAILIGGWFLFRYASYKKQIPTAIPSSVTSTVNQSNDDLRTEVQKISTTDSDLDGIPNQTEQTLGTDPANPDTDGDGLLDGDEVNVFHSNPVKSDTDGDGISDGKAVRSGKDPRGGFLPAPVKIPSSTNSL